jgi:hypothetical protein
MICLIRYGYSYTTMDRRPQAGATGFIHYGCGGAIEKERKLHTSQFRTTAVRVQAPQTDPAVEDGGVTEGRSDEMIPEAKMMS